MAIVVFDIGKTNIKLSLVEAGAIRRTMSAPNRSLPGPPYPHINEAGIWAFLLRGLTSLAAEAEITDIIVVTHGAAAALVDTDGKLVLPILDYETPIEDPDYDCAASPFAETFSPAMAGGLNLGRQIHWQSQKYPEDFARVRYILPYPQYWSFRLCGIASSEVTYLGCHTGLWQPAAGTFSSFVAHMGWQDLFAPLRRADEVLGAILPEIRAETGLPATCRVRVGIHDSSASFLRHRMSRPSPFAVVSTGTWVVCMAAGADVAGLLEDRRCLANVDALGTPVPCSLFMGGREFSTLMESVGAYRATTGDAAAVIDSGAMLVPPISDLGGPFVGLERGGARGATLRIPEERAAQASLYLALMTDYCLDLIKSSGPVVIEGSLIGNDLYLSSLAALRRSEGVIVSDDATGTVSGAAILAGQKIQGSSRSVMPLDLPVAEYRERWREALPA